MKLWCYEASVLQCKPIMNVQFPLKIPAVVFPINLLCAVFLSVNIQKAKFNKFYHNKAIKLEAIFLYFDQ